MTLGGPCASSVPSLAGRVEAAAASRVRKDVPLAQPPRPPQWGHPRERASYRTSRQGLPRTCHPVTQTFHAGRSVQQKQKGVRAQRAGTFTVALLRARRCPGESLLNVRDSGKGRSPHDQHSLCELLFPPKGCSWKRRANTRHICFRGTPWSSDARTPKDVITTLGPAAV